MGSWVGVRQKYLSRVGIPDLIVDDWFGRDSKEFIQRLGFG
jgi:hypothetical protein